MFFKESTRILSSRPNLPVPDTISSRCCITSSRSGASQRPRARNDHHTDLTIRNSGNAPGLRCGRFSTRCFASVSSPRPKRLSSAADGYTWPVSLNPTPYEILAHPRRARYDKALFYELVKIYHPDRNHTTAGSALPQAVRLERYRLVVAANEILSDDAKRKAYDLYGAGWNGNRTLQSLYREADRSWRNEPGNASRNATWEDWERWRRERNGESRPQTPVFMSNELFVIVLCSFVVVGSFAQARRASTTTLNVVEMRDQKHAAISDGIKRRQNEQAHLNRHERVENFLRQRDSWNIVSSRDNGHESPS
ncbi:hypothetical protein O1611_g6605 [Lasiodiplodia mahajangana]|uniref:Uncharacterized protein n=1 Tax=Lasiodiplodia mahajangana TaxID=1108764 RepID=A0ACC2JIH9_9PEZI|nr:hypothetical protein O1611_g6605 [Lasiodiplodia mahajangana]